jgi:hypothetical protein
MEHIIKNLKVVGFYIPEVETNGLYLEDENGVGYRLYSSHISDCCEVHYLAFDSLELSEFEGLLFDFDTEDLSNSIERVKGSGIRLKPNNGHPIFIPGYSCNNGFYSDDITLVFSRYGYDDVYCQIDVTDCQPEY